MSLYLDDGDVRLYAGDAETVLAQLPEGSVHCVATSPPFFGLRDYATGRWEGGDDPECDHKFKPGGTESSTLDAWDNGLNAETIARKVEGYGRMLYRERCRRCGALRVDQQIGLESTPDAWAASIVAVMREARRVLRDDGSLWVECGDSYNSHPGQRSVDDVAGSKQASNAGSVGAPSRAVQGLKPKDLVGAPYLLAFALRNDGWVWRGAYVWEKPDAMPESVRDRCTTSHSTILHFSKAKWVGPEPGRFDVIAESDKRWLAAMIDAEGCILVKRAKKKGANDTFQAQVAFVNTNLDLVAEVQRITGDAWYAQTRNEQGRRPCVHMTISSRAASELLQAIYPYLIAKQRQARVVVHAQAQLYHRGGIKGRQGAGRSRTDDEDSLLDRCWSTCKALNQGVDADIAWVPEPKRGRWVAQPYFFDREAIREPFSDYRMGSSYPSGIPETHTSKGNPDRGDDGLVRGPIIDRRPQSEVLPGFSPEAPRGPDGRRALQVEAGSNSHQHRDGSRWPSLEGRSPRSVWRITTEASSFGLCRVCRTFWAEKAPARHCGEPVVAHFAVWPHELVGKIISAATSEGGCCSACGAPRARWINAETRPNWEGGEGQKHAAGTYYRPNPGGGVGTDRREREDLGWQPTCECDAPSEPCVVLDPFAGSATTARQARLLGRRAVLIELNPDYAEIAAHRLSQQALALLP